MDSEEQKTEVTQGQTSKNEDPFKMLYVLLVVLIICGGNGMGIICAALIWKYTGQIVTAVITAVVITIVAFILGMMVVVVHNKKK